MATRAILLSIPVSRPPPPPDVQDGSRRWRITSAPWWSCAPVPTPFNSAMPAHREVRLARPSGASLHLRLSPPKVCSWTAVAFHGGREEMLCEQGIVLDLRARPVRHHLGAAMALPSEPSELVDVAWRLPDQGQDGVVDEVCLCGEAGPVSTSLCVRITDADVKVQVTCRNRDAERAWCVHPNVEAHWKVADVAGLRFERRASALDMRDRGRRLTTRCRWEGFPDVAAHVRRASSPPRASVPAPWNAWLASLLQDAGEDEGGELYFQTMEPEDAESTRRSGRSVLQPHETWSGHVSWALCD